MRFTVLVHDDEDGGYWVSVPELPGCFTQGDTLEEVELNVKDAIECYLELANKEDIGTLAKARRWEVDVPVVVAAQESAPAAATQAEVA